MTRILTETEYAHFVDRQVGKKAGDKVLDVAQALSQMAIELKGVKESLKRLEAATLKQYVGTQEACTILGIGRTTLMERINNGLYPFAFKDDTGHWRFSVQELQRSIAG